MNEIITGAVHKLDALQPGIATADLTKDTDFAAPSDPNALKMVQVMQLGI